MICKFYDHNITIAFPLRHELCQIYRYRYECNLVKNLSTYWETKEENREINKNILASWRSWWVLKENHVAGEKLSNPMTGDWEGKPDKESIDKKTLKTSDKNKEKDQ